VVYNVVTSRALRETIRAHGGTPFRSRVGHSFVKPAMADHDAVFGAEHSGHFYLRDFWYADSGMLAARHVLGALAGSALPLSGLVSALSPYRASGELNVITADPAGATALVRAVRRLARNDRRRPGRADGVAPRVVAQRAAVQHRTAAPAERGGRRRCHHGVHPRRRAEADEAALIRRQT
jgi:phosphomannomutase